MRKTPTFLASLSLALSLLPQSQAAEVKGKLIFSDLKNENEFEVQLSPQDQMANVTTLKTNKTRLPSSGKLILFGPPHSQEITLQALPHLEGSPARYQGKLDPNTQSYTGIILRFGFESYKPKLKTKLKNLDRQVSQE